jgi:hypothetical protein
MIAGWHGANTSVSAQTYSYCLFDSITNIKTTAPSSPSTVAITIHSRGPHMACLPYSHYRSINRL